MSEIVAIVGDADLHCLACAVATYGEPAVDLVIAGGVHVDAYNGIGPKDREGNVLTPVWAADAWLCGGEPEYCGDCGMMLWEWLR